MARTTARTLPLLLGGLVLLAACASEPSAADVAHEIQAQSRTVLYEVEGTASSVSVTLQTPTGTSQGTGKAVPLHNATTGVPGLSFTFPAGSFVYLSAQNEGGSGTVTCRITSGGRVVSENTASGGYSIASCKGTA